MGMAQSGDLKEGFRNNRYHNRIPGCVGEGLLEALNARGTMNAPDAKVAARRGGMGVALP